MVLPEAALHGFNLAAIFASSTGLQSLFQYCLSLIFFDIVKDSLLIRDIITALEEISVGLMIRRRSLAYRGRQ